VYRDIKQAVCFLFAFAGNKRGENAIKAEVLRGERERSYFDKNRHIKFTVCKHVCVCAFAIVPGESKGYGFVEYTTKETALHAKNLLDKKIVEDWVLCCDWLDASHVTFESLHSKCLYVDRLPKDFRDMGQFRKVFSSIISPPYCQVSAYTCYILLFIVNKLVYKFSTHDANGDLDGGV